jgi:hypothetical protein
MSVRHLLVAALLAALTAAPDAQAQLGTSFTVEGFGGYQNLRPSGDSITNAARGNEGTGILGADVLAGIGGFGVGAVVDKVVSGNNGKPWAGALMAGILVPLTVVRLELLGELGRRSGLSGDLDELFKSGGRTFVGVRPGVSFRLAPTAIVLGVSGDVRWDTTGGDVGSPDYAIVARVGFGFF